MGALWADVVFSWFGSAHALFPTAFARVAGKASIIVASGFDVANEPEIAYGNMRPGIGRWIGKTTYGLANAILAVSQFTAGELAKNVGANSSKVITIPHGFVVSQGPIGPCHRDLVVTIGAIRWITITCKGLDTFVRTARHLPDMRFKLIGRIEDNAIDYLRSFAPKNVEFRGYVTDAGNSSLVRSAGTYVQVSYYESFGCAVAEAMMQGCIPVTTRRGALPEVVGDTGYYVSYNDPRATASAIAEAASATMEQREFARRRIVELFPLSKRCDRLLAAVEMVGRKGNPCWSESS
jgi:glycosyltransferase involved in cell wall biosynthesis